MQIEPSTAAHHSWRPQHAGAAGLDRRKLTVCMVAPTPFPANQGTPGSIREMAEAICQRGHDVHIVTYHVGEDIPVIGPTIHRIPSLFRESKIFVGPTARRPIYDLQMIFKTLQVIRRTRPDLLHAHGYEAALIAWVCRTLTRVPFIYSGHNTMGDELPSYRAMPVWFARWLAKALDGFVPRLPDRCLPHSANMDLFFRRQGLALRTDGVIPFGINLDHPVTGDPSAVRNRYGLADRPVVLYSGLLDEFQRLDLLLEAMRFVSQGYHDGAPRLLVVQTLPNEKHANWLKQRIVALGLQEHVVVTDPQTLDALPEFLLACDVAVVPRPQVPGFPIKLLNYMAASRACVLFASSTSHGLVHGENAYLVEEESGQALGAGILEVLRDRGLHERLARGGHEFVRQHHDRRLVAERVCQAYYRTLQFETSMEEKPSAVTLPIHDFVDPQSAASNHTTRCRQEPENSRDVALDI